MKALLKIVLSVVLVASFSTVALASKIEYKKLNQRMALLYKNGRNEQAIKTALEIIKVAEATFGKDHVYYSSSLENLAMLYIAEGGHDKAVALYEKSLKLREGNQGKNSPRLKKVLEKIASCYKELGKSAEVKKAQDRLANL